MGPDHNMGRKGIDDEGNLAQEINLIIKKSY